MGGRTLAQRYILRGRIAAGAIGTVWRAEDRRTGEAVAIKVLHPQAARQADVVAAFREEARVLTELEHPGVVRPREFLVVDEEPALVMDLVAGTDLRRLLTAHGPLAPGTAAAVLAQVCEALVAVHAAGIVHGDLKPGNILVPEPAGSPGVRLADFGVAHRVRRPFKVTHATPEYVAPEVVDGRSPVPASDVYAAGIVLYEALCGRSPFRGGSVDEVLRRHRGHIPVRLPGMPDELWSLIAGCLRLDPACRPTAARVAARLRTLAPALAGLPPVPVAPTARMLQPRPEVSDGATSSVPGTPAAASVGSEDPVRPTGPDPVAPATDTAAGQSSEDSVPWRAGHRRVGRRRAGVLVAAAASVTLLAALVFGGWLLSGGRRPQHPTAPTAEQPRRAAGRPPATPAPSPTSGGHPARSVPGSPAPTGRAPVVTSPPADGEAGQGTNQGNTGQNSAGQSGTPLGSGLSGHHRDHATTEGDQSNADGNDLPGLGDPMPTMPGGLDR